MTYYTDEQVAALARANVEQARELARLRDELTAAQAAHAALVEQVRAPARTSRPTTTRKRTSKRGVWSDEWRDAYYAAHPAEAERRAAWRTPAETWLPVWPPSQFVGVAEIWHHSEVLQPFVVDRAGTEVMLPQLTADLTDAPAASDRPHLTATAALGAA